MVERDLAGFRASLAQDGPPAGLTPPLLGLWWQGKGEWDRAHATVQKDGSRAASWVHAHLHRVEGDLGNAAYWYARAGREPATGDLDREWAAIAAALLNEG